MRQVLAPILFDDDEPEAAEASRASPVAKAQRSPAAKSKATTKRTNDGQPVHSFRSLLADLATIARNVVSFGKAGELTMFTKPTMIQQRAFDLLGVKI